MHFADSAIDRRPTILAEDGQRIEEGDELSAPTPSPENFSFEDETHRHRLKPRERAHTLKDALKRSLKRH